MTSRLRRAILPQRNLLLNRQLALPVPSSKHAPASTTAASMCFSTAITYFTVPTFPPGDTSRRWLVSRGLELHLLRHDPLHSIRFHLLLYQLDLSSPPASSELELEPRRCRTVSPFFRRRREDESATNCLSWNSSPSRINHLFWSYPSWMKSDGAKWAFCAREQFAGNR